MQFLTFLDAAVTKQAAAIIPHSPLTQSVFAFFSFAGGTFLVWLVPFIILILLEEQKDRRFILYFAAASLITVFLVDIVLKNIFLRPRPYLAWGLAAPVCPQSSSFPSGHAAFSFAAATMLSAFDRKRSVWYYAAALLVSYSRVFLYCHYFFDVAAGAVIGYCISRLILIYHHRSGKDPGSPTGKSRQKAKKG